MKNPTAFILFNFLFLIGVFAQSTALECSKTTPFSLGELNGLTFTMPTENSPGTQPNPLCIDGGAAHNITWISFIAGEGDYTIQISGSNCSGSTSGMDGRQFGVYTDCTFTEYVYCDPTCVIDTITLTSDVFEAGQEYFIFVDGCFGSVCEIRIDVLDDNGNPLSVSDPFNEINTISYLKVFPNPTKDFLFIDSDEPMQEVLIFNTRMQLILRQNLNEPLFTTELNVESLVSGLYMVQIRASDKHYYSKIIIE